MMEQGPHAICQELGDWTIKKFEGWNIVFFKGKNYIPQDDDLRQDFFMITKWQDTLGNSKLTMLCNNITGGPDCAHMLKIMCVDVALVNNSKSTGLPLAPLSFLLKGLNQHGHLRIVLWILSRTYHQLMDLILFWSW